MTDNDIVLEYGYCHINQCNKCPRYEQCLSDFANGKCPPKGIRREILDLMNRQKAEIEEQKSEIAILKDSNINLQELYYNQKEKVEKAKQKVVDTCKKLQDAEAEIERLEKHTEMYHELEPKQSKSLPASSLTEQSVG